MTLDYYRRASATPNHSIQMKIPLIPFALLRGSEYITVQKKPKVQILSSIYKHSNGNVFEFSLNIVIFSFKILSTLSKALRSQNQYNGYSGRRTLLVELEEATETMKTNRRAPQCLPDH